MGCIDLTDSGLRESKTGKNAHEDTVEQKRAKASYSDE